MFLLMFLCSLIFWAMAYNMGNVFLSRFQTYSPHWNTIEITVLWQAAVMRRRKGHLHWIFQLSDRSRGLIEVEAISPCRSACVQAKEMPLLGKQLCFMLIFICTLKSSTTIVENLDSCVRGPGSFSEAMHLQFLLTIVKLGRMVSTCNLTCSRLRVGKCLRHLKELVWTAAQ